MLCVKNVERPFPLAGAIFFTTPNNILPMDFGSNRGLIAIFFCHLHRQCSMVPSRSVSILGTKLSPHPATEVAVQAWELRNSEGIRMRQGLVHRALIGQKS